MIYFLNQNIYISETTGEFFDADMMDKLEQDHKNLPKFSLLELAQVYSKTKTIRYINKNITKIEETIKGYANHVQWLYTKKTFNNDHGINGLIESNRNRIKDLTEQKKHLISIKRLINNPLKEGSPTIEQAKRVPISNFIKFSKAGFAKCIWHQEKTPSLRYYPKTNSVYCFSCGKSGDVINVLMHLNNESFLTTIKKLQ